MNSENYKSKRNNPTKNSATKKAKTQMKTAPKVSTSTASSSKLRAIYNTKTEWVTKVIPKTKEN
jgi:hypothetical protein